MCVCAVTQCCRKGPGAGTMVATDLRGGISLLSYAREPLPRGLKDVSQAAARSLHASCAVREAGRRSPDPNRQGKEQHDDLRTEDSPVFTPLARDRSHANERMTRLVHHVRAVVVPLYLLPCIADILHRGRKEGSTLLGVAP